MPRLPKLDRLGIPKKIVNGKSRKYRSVGTIYRATLIKELMTRINAAFWVKAKRGTDDLGNRWKPLSPKTHAYKPFSPIEKNTYDIDGTLERGLLTPDQNRIWKMIFARKLKLFKKRGESDRVAKKKAAEAAWGFVKSKGARTKLGLNRITDTNIRTGRLVAATKPGTVANNRYYPPRNQIVKVLDSSISIKIDLPYADKVDEVRPIIPRDINKWIIESHNIAIREAKRTYDSLQNTTKKRPRVPNNKTRPQPTKSKRDRNSTRR